jgi:hypothetical protein
MKAAISPQQLPAKSRVPEILKHRVGTKLIEELSLLDALE